MGGDSVFIAGEEEDEGFESADDGSWLAAPPSTERKFVRAEVQALDEEISRLDSLLEPSVVDDESEGVEPFGPGPFPSEAQMRETLRKQEQILEEIKKGFAERRDNILRMYRNRKQQVKELLQQRPIINLLDKITFFTSIACLATTEFIILKKPQWITEWYTGWMLTLLAVRYKLYHRLKYHYFMLDFCYFTQGLFMFYVYYYPLPRLFVVLFSVSNGSLAWAIVAWRNSMVLHDLDKMTSVALHLFPTLVTFTLRWYPSDSSHSRVCYRPDCSLTFMDAVFSPLPVYLLWQAFYYMKTEIVDRDKFTANSDIQTSFRWLARSPGHPVYKLIRKAPENTRVLVFLVIQLLYTLLTALPVKFLFEYFYLHLAFIIGITGACVWNGGNYYVEYLWKRQMLQQELQEQQLKEEAKAKRTQQPEREKAG